MPVKDADGNDVEKFKKLAEAWPDVMLQASEKEFSSKHWELLTGCGDNITSYKHSSSGDRVIVETISWPQPDGEGKMGFFIFAGDHKDYMLVLKDMTKSGGKLKAKEKKRKKRD